MMMSFFIIVIYLKILNIIKNRGIVKVRLHTNWLV
jgi:hypothetical protein